MKHCIVMLFLWAAFSCAHNPEPLHKESNSPGRVTEALAKHGAGIGAAQTAPQAHEKTKLIKTAHYRFKVHDVKKSTASIENAIKKYPAYISTSNLSLERDLLENKITIRVQHDYFNDLLNDIDKQAVLINYRNVSTEDVAKEFVDLESRLKTKREVEARYTEILRKKAGTIEELLAAEKQIGELHEEIEATISRLNFLKDQVSYSTINLEFYQLISQDVIAKTEEGLLAKFASAFATGFEGILQFMLALAYIWPVLLIGAASLFWIKRRKKRAITLKNA